MKQILKTLLPGLLLFMLVAGRLNAQTNLDNGASNSPAVSMAADSKAAKVPGSAPFDGSGVPTGVDNPPNALSVPEAVLGILAVLGMFLATIAMGLFYKHRQDRLAHETLRAMIEKGVPITPELVAQLGSSRRNRQSGPSHASRNLLRGLILVVVGVGLMALSPEHSVPHVAGIIVLFISAAFFIVWLVERSNHGDTQPPKS